MIDNATILITGGTGFFGTAMARRLLTGFKPKKLIIYSRDEYKQFLMAEKFREHEDHLRFFIGDIRDKDRLARAFYDVDYVFHAGALKQVPACEYNPFEAVKTNIEGTQNVIDCAIDRGVKKVVALSTDKAVNPISLYGATKLAADKIFVSANAYAGSKNSVFAVLRSGNLAGSRGSVIPFFKMLIDKGEKELPITDMRMTRYWATVEEAVDLALVALRESCGGEIFVSKIPSFRITDLARALKPDCGLKEIGIRDGEKIHEIMITEYDSLHTREYDGHYIIFPTRYKLDKGRGLMEKGKKVEPFFQYTSDNNADWLTETDLRVRIGKLEVS